jgi:hypothetical protein
LTKPDKSLLFDPKLNIIISQASSGQNKLTSEETKVSSVVKNGPTNTKLKKNKLQNIAFEDDDLMFPVTFDYPIIGEPMSLESIIQNKDK